MEAYMEDMVYQKQTDVETQIKNTARESILAIQRQESAIRDAKRVLAGYGIFDSLDEAYLYVKENAASSDYPLYITKEEDHKYHVKEHLVCILEKSQLLFYTVHPFVCSKRRSFLLLSMI